jgi:predicted ribosome-associated RNA-binding protein Tma20
MFKNDLSPSQSYIFSKKEKKDFFKKLGIFYNKITVDIISTKLEANYVCQKVTIANSKRRIIFYENNPIFFEFDNDNFYPTIYLVNMFPDLIKNFALIYDETDSYLDNGADLMLKGVLNRVDLKNSNFKMGELFIVVTMSGYENKYLI